MINKSQGSTFGGEEDSNWSVFAKCLKVWDDNSCWCWWWLWWCDWSQDGGDSNFSLDDPVNIGDNNYDDDDDDDGDDGGDGGRDDVIEAPVVVVDQIAILMYLRPDYYKKPPRHSPSMMPVSRRLWRAQF